MTSLPRLLALAVVLSCALLIAGASATTPLGEQVRATEHGTPNSADTPAVDSAVAYNTKENQFLLVWEGGVPGTLGKTEIYGRILDAAGSPVGGEFRISQTSGDQNNDARTPDVIYDPMHEVYFVVWQQSNPGARSDIYGASIASTGFAAQIGNGQNLTRLNVANPTPPPAVAASDPVVAWNPESGHATLAWIDNRAGQGGTEVHAADVVTGMPNGLLGPAPIRVSDMGGNANGYAAQAPGIAYDPVTKDFLIVWAGDDNMSPLVDNEFEIFSQRLGIGSDPANPLDPIFERVGDNTRVSDLGPNGNTAYTALNPSVAHDAGSGQFLIAWQGPDGDTPLPPADQEIYGRRADFSDPAGITIIGEDTRYSDMGPDNDGNYTAQNAAVTANPVASEFLIAWDGDDDTVPLANNEEEVFVQRVAANGSEIQADTVVSDMGPVLNNVFYRGLRPALSLNSVTGNYLVAWEGDDDSVGVGQQGVDDEFEIWTRQVAGGPVEPPDGTPPGGGIPGTTGPPSAPNCATAPAPSTASSSGTPTVSVAQLKINQRIGQAAVRRANAIQAWLDDGIVSGDLCGGSLAPERLAAGISTTSGVLGPVPTIAGPRPLVIPPAADKGKVTFTLTTRQLQTNQRVYAAAVRRANALKARVEGGLTGGDIVDGQLGRDRLRQDLTINSLTPTATPAPASTSTAAAAASTPADFTLTAAQLRINQRIAQAAVRRTNELRALLASGLKGENFAEGSISAVDLTP